MTCESPSRRFVRSRRSSTTRTSRSSCPSALRSSAYRASSARDARAAAIRMPHRPPLGRWRAVAIRLIGDTAKRRVARRSTSSPAPIRYRSPRAIITCGRRPVRRPASMSEAWCWGRTRSGAPIPLGPGGSLANFTQSADRVPGELPAVHVVNDGRTEKKLRSPARSRAYRSGWCSVRASARVEGNGRGDRGRLHPRRRVRERVARRSELRELRRDAQWTPQRSVWIALAISAQRCSSASHSHSGRAAGEGAPRRRRRGTQGEPELASPLVSDAGSRGGAASSSRPAGAGLAAAFVSRWWIGDRRRLRAGDVVAPAAALPAHPRCAASLAVTALYVIVQQHRYRYLV